MAAAATTPVLRPAALLNDICARLQPLDEAGLAVSCTSMSPWRRHGKFVQWFSGCVMLRSRRPEPALARTGQRATVLRYLSQASIPSTALRLKEKTWTSFSGLSLGNWLVVEA